MKNVEMKGRRMLELARTPEQKIDAIAQMIVDHRADQFPRYDEVNELYPGWLKVGDKEKEDAANLYRRARRISCKALALLEDPRPNVEEDEMKNWERLMKWESDAASLIGLMRYNPQLFPGVLRVWQGDFGRIAIAETDGYHGAVKVLAWL